jgi:succinate dehydrogenase / fumarate reductase, flavoprotein subunit
VLDVAFEEDADSDAGRKVAAVVAYEMATGDIHVFQTKAVLFASGGFGRMFKISSNAVSLTGDGPGLLLRRGIPMQDMEFFQFHPTGIYKLGILLSEAARGEGGILRNADGERFMERYAPTVKDLAPRDMVSRSIMTEIREGRGAGPDQDMVYLDLTHLPPEQIDEKLPDITDFVRTYLGIEPKKDPIPIQPTAHYAMGGIPTNVDGQVIIDADHTVLPGLYAAGECACVSVHGANRLGTNSLLDIVVFGRRGGRDMVRFVDEVGMPEMPEGAEADVKARIEKMKAGTGSENTADLRSVLQEEMTANAMVFRTEESLAHATDVVDDLTARYEEVKIDDKGDIFNYDLTEALELGYLIELAKVTVASARARTESRGAHFRDDHPLREDEHWMKHTLAHREDDGAVRLDYKPVIGGNYEPMERKY